MTTLTVIDEREVCVDATVDEGRVRISADDLASVTGWELKPEGLCRGPVCVPFKSDTELVDLNAFAQALGRSFVFDAEGEVAAIAGDPMGSQGGLKASIDELELPNVDGETIRMSDFAGRKRLLIAWASW